MVEQVKPSYKKRDKPTQVITRKDFQPNDKKISGTKIHIDGKSPLAKSLVSRGVQKQTFNIPAFSLEDSVSGFTSEVEGLKAKSISKQEQIDMMQKIFQNPFHAPYICCLSGKPNDLKAKLLATYIMGVALSMQQNKKAPDKSKRYLENKSLPIYSNVFGWSTNKLLEQQEKPSLLILGNVPQGMTQYKQEKLRDLLEMYSSIPRIIVTANHDPLTFFNGSLFMHLNACCYLTNSMVKKAYEV